MGIEGHESPRDVASEEQKHPWEIFPKDESSANLSEKERENLKKKKENKNKRDMQLSKTKKWVNSHHILILSVIIAIVILVAGGIFAVYKMKENDIKKEGQTNEDDGTALIVYGFPEDFKIKDAYTAHNAFQYATEIVQKVALEGIEDPYSDTTKIEDNMSLFIENLNTDYEKLYFRIYTCFLLAKYENPSRAMYLLQNIDAENHTFDKNQRYMYYKAQMEYYYILDDNENSEIWRKKIQDDAEFTEDTYVYVDEDSGEMVRDEELIKVMKEKIRKEKEEREAKK